MTNNSSANLLDLGIIFPAIAQSFVKLDPRSLARNPVMFVVALVSALTTILFIKDVVIGNGSEYGFTLQIIAWLWFTVIFANFAEAVAEGRGKAQADALRRSRTETTAKLLAADGTSGYTIVPGTSLQVGDLVVVEAGEIIPSDGEVVEGAIPPTRPSRS